MLSNNLDHKGGSKSKDSQRESNHSRVVYPTYLVNVSVPTTRFVIYYELWL